MKKSILLIFSLCISIAMHAQVSKTVNVTTAGTLNKLLTLKEDTTVTNLTITGSIDARDFVTMRDSMPNLYILDLSLVNIVAYSGPNGTFYSKFIGLHYEGSTNYLANEIPCYAFVKLYQNTGGSGGAIMNKILSSIIFPTSITSIGIEAFAYCQGLKGTLNIPQSVISIGSGAFAGCEGYTGTLIIPQSVTSIGSDAFAGCDGFTGTLSIPQSATQINSGTFSNCKGITSVNLSTSIISIGDNAFYECGLIGVLNIPTSVQSIGKYAFYCNYGLTSLSIPASVTSIGTKAFAFVAETLGVVHVICLQSIYDYSVMPINLTSSPNVFNDVNYNTCALYVPTGSVTRYEGFAQWQDFLNIEEMPATGISPLNEDNMYLFPNPAKESFTINNEGSATVDIYSMNGTLILSKTVSGKENIQISQFTTGLYIVKIIKENAVSIRTLIVE